MQRLNYITWQGPDFQQERDVATCSHCQLQMILPPARDGRVVVRVAATCSGCGKFICNVCHGQGCKTWERQMEEIEARSRMLDAIGVAD